eukprot:maker-scaffold818_size92908-snap-gene-0.20 protein:Tk10595 transcript:maker-scaffold818_size92908-snap-gene-0.20-mRNA-1 annotation:"f-box lrr-repeat protein 7-like"
MTPLPKDHRLSPRCIISNGSESCGSSLTSTGPRGMSPFGRSVGHSRQSSVLSNQSSCLDLSMSSSSFCRQGSLSSVGENPAKLDVILALHSRQSSTDSGGTSTLASDIVAGARRKTRSGASQARNSATPPLHKLPPYVPPHKVSPSSLDLGYHTMLSQGGIWDGTAESSPLSSMELSPCPTNVTKPRPPKIPTQYDSGVNLDMANLSVEYKSPKRSYFDWLSDELILNVMSYLSTPSLCLCSRVCRRFYFLAWEPQLWRDITLSGDQLNVDLALATLLKLVARDSAHLMCSSIEKVSLHTCSRLSDAGLFLISQRCPNLRSLSLKGCRSITNLSVQAVVSRCTGITHLDLTGCSAITTVDLRSSADPCPATAALVGVPPGAVRSTFLHYLDLTDCTRVSDAGLGIILKNAPSLQHLYLRRCVNITDVGIKFVASQCPSLRELSISDCAQITDFGLYELAKLGPNLRYLSVAKCDQISDSGVQQIAKLCYKLRYLNVRGCEAVSDVALECLSKSCTRLRSLDIGKCDVTDVGLKLLGEHCPSLKKLSLKSCEMISDQGLQNIAYRCRGLQQLNIQDSPITIDGYRTVKKFCAKCIIEHTNPGFY